MIQPPTRPVSARRILAAVMLAALCAFAAAPAPAQDAPAPADAATTPTAAAATAAETTATLPADASTSPVLATLTRQDPATSATVIIEELAVGAGDEVVKGRTAHLHYAGWVRGGVLIDNSRIRPLPFPLGAKLGENPPRLIPGMEMGIEGMKVGGHRRIIIPPELGYGPVDRGEIPGNSTLVFEVELVKVSD